MKLKHGTVRLDAAAVWLSKATGRTFTPGDLIDAHDRLPIYAVIPESKCNPKHSEPVIREFREKAIEVERLTNSHVRSLGGLAAADAGVPRGLFTAEAIAEVAIQRMRPDIALLQKWERAAKRQSVYLLSDEDVSILAANGEVRLGRGVSVFNRWIGRPIQFGNPVNVTIDMLCVLRSQLLKLAEIVAVEQPEGRPAAQEQAAPAKPAAKRLRDFVKDAVARICAHEMQDGTHADCRRMPGTAIDLLWAMGKLHPDQFAEMKIKAFREHYKGVCQWPNSAPSQAGAMSLYLEIFPELRRSPAPVVQIRK